MNPKEIREKARKDAERLSRAEIDSYVLRVNEEIDDLRQQIREKVAVIEGYLDVAYGR